MPDLVNIGFKVRTNEIEQGYNRLGKMKDQAAKTETQLDKMTNTAKMTAKSFAVFATAVVGSTSAISAILYQLANTERELQASARMAGLTTDQFEAMTFAYKQFGLTVEQVNDIYKDSRERIGEWLNSQSGALQDFGDAMGMSKEEITAFAKEVDGLNGQQLLQRMVDDLQAAGVSGNQMSGVMEAMASEATRMIPALENNGKAVSSLSQEYAKFNASFSLDDEDVRAYADLAKNFDLFLDTATNAVTKVLAPLAEGISVLTLEILDFFAALDSSSVSAAQNRYDEALASQLEARQKLADASKLIEVPGRGMVPQDVAKRAAQNALEAANKEVEAAQKQLDAAQTRAKASIENNRTLTRNVNVRVIGGSQDTKEDNEKTKAIEKQAQAYDRWLDSVRSAADPAARLQGEITELWMAMLNGDLATDVATKRIEQLNQEIDELNQKENPFTNLASGATQSLSAIQRLAEDGTDAYKQLERAINAVNLAQSLATGNIAGAIGAGVGLLMTFDKEIKDFSAEIQANQNLNIWGEKADSIAEATDITAQATEKLVGINSDMLDALKVVRQGISGASGLIARDKGSAQVNVGGLGIIGNPLTDTGIGKFLTKGLDLNILNILSGGLLSGLGKALGGLLGGKSKVTGEGIRIVGGYITDFTDSVLVQAYQDVSYKKHRFGSTKYKRSIKTLSGQVRSQFSLVFGSIIDSVSAGAGALGLSDKEIQRAVDEFRLGTSELNLKGMSQSRQQKALEAYFSRVFNNLATTVIPFLDEFQKAGEELGETLSRLATEVSVAEYLVDNLGVTFADKMANPKEFAQAADNLATLAGGTEKLIDQVSSFTDTFASDTQKFDIYQGALSEALNEVGLTLPSSAQGFFDLMGTIDGTTEAGQRQIATLLSLTDTADGYFRILDRSVGKFREAAEGLFSLTEASRKMSLESALTAARFGDFSLAEQLDLSSVGPQTKDFSSRLEFNLARAETAARLNELADLQSGQVSVDEKQLTVLEQIRDKLSDNGTMNQSEVAERVGKLEVTMKKLITESNDYLRRSAYQGA